MASKTRRKERHRSPSRAPILSKLDAAFGSGPETAHWWIDALLVALVVLPNLTSLSGAFLLDDLPLIRDNPRVHSTAKLPEIWTSGYWPDRSGLTLYRPVTVSVWCLAWVVGGGSPLPFHLLNVALAATVVVLLFRFLLSLGLRRGVAAASVALFAVMPIHSEAIASVVGSAELLAAVFGVGSLLLLRNDRPLPGCMLFALAVLSKESAAALAAIAWLASRPPRITRWTRWLALGGIILAALVARSAVATGAAFVPAVDNPMSLLPAGKRVLTALWVQCLYVWKSLVPLSLSADYSYKQIPLVMGLHDLRAWAGLGLALLFAVTIARSDRLRFGALWYVIAFVPASNLLFPVGTVMGERLAYLPSVGLALMVIEATGALAGRFAAAAQHSSGARRLQPAGSTDSAPSPFSPIARATGATLFVAVIFGYGWRSANRNRVWHDAPTFYTALVASSPESAKAHYFYGCLLAGEGDDPRAIAAYDRAIAIFPAYSEAFHNRGNALARLGRHEEAGESYANVLRFDPGHAGAEANLRAIEAGEPLMPPRRRL